MEYDKVFCKVDLELLLYMSQSNLGGMFEYPLLGPFKPEEVGRHLGWWL